MIAAIESKFITSVSRGVASTFHVLSRAVAPGIFNGGNPELVTVTLLIILMLTGVCVVGNFARIPAFGKVISTTPRS